MKTIKLKNILLLVFGLVVLTSCVEDDDFNTPNLSIQEPNLEGSQIVPLSSVAGELAQAQDGNTLDYNDESTVFTYDVEGVDQYMEAYVVSSDEGGNFFKELVVQDNFENPTIGLKISIDVNPLYIRYEVGRKIYVKLNDLTVGIRNGVLALGKIDGNRVGRIAQSDEEKVILRSAEVQTIVPLVMDISDFTDDKTNLLIRLQDVQFNRVDALSSPPKTFASESGDQFDGNRPIESCATSGSVLLKTSTFADFKSLRLPTGRGNIDAILTKDFFGDDFNVTVSTPETINLDSDERCDPGEFIISPTPLECNDTPIIGATTVFSENFETYSNVADLINGGWILINVGGGSYTWGLGSFGSNTYAIGNGFNANEQNIDTWLISPVINLDGTTEDVLNFDVQTNFNVGEVMSVYVSSDFVDVSNDANWSLLADVDIPNGPSNGFGTFQSAGPVSLSCVSGTVRLGFRYTGSDPGITTRYHVDNIVITGN